MKLGKLTDLIKEIAQLEFEVEKEESRSFDPSPNRERLQELREKILSFDEVPNDQA